MQKVLIFGKSGCSACEGLKSLIDRLGGKQGEDYIYYDISTVDGLAELSIRGLGGKCGDTPLPVVITEQVD